MCSGTFAVPPFPPCVLPLTQKGAARAADECSLSAWIRNSVPDMDDDHDDHDDHDAYILSYETSPYWLWPPPRMNICIPDFRFHTFLDSFLFYYFIRLLLLISQLLLSLFCTYASSAAAC